ncbi:ABC transporter substrate-binding protein [Clostridium lacusfryxellense]|uniref:ABC transporter substrate-binding protein n=1 Tax=Clostridium lacusfryxellense TaxID=205328 RepID=UPI001C0BAFBC|nr:extracellular solute-binding protein [Clostridium lacusfryxellense]MBU3112772.1 extracellular solute-binding protein [Clostridium lacusfryxellense]
MKKPISILLAAILTGTLAMSGCSKADDSSKGKVDENAAVKLSITWWGSQSRHDYTNKLLEMYTAKNPNITFQATPSGWDGYFDKISAQAAGDTMPDIMQMDYSFISTYSKNDTLADLTPYVTDKTIDLATADTNLVNTGKVNGKLTGVVLGGLSLAMTYNPDVVAKAGLEVPTSKWTWADFEKDMIQIKQKTGTYGQSKIDNISTYPYWVRQYGKTMYSADGTKLGYDNDKVFVDYVSMLKRLQDAKAMPNPDEWAQISAKGKEAEPVVTGQAGATLDWSNYAVIVSKSNPNLKIVTPPYSETGTKALWNKPSMFFSVAKSSKNQKEAAKFINWFLNDPEANKVINAERGIPVSSKIRDSLKASLTAQQKDMFDYADITIANSTKADPADPAGVAEVTKALTDTVNSFLYGKTTAEASAADFRTKANEILGRNSK